MRVAPWCCDLGCCSRAVVLLLTRLFGNNVPGHTTRAPPVGFELATNGIQFNAIANLDKTFHKEMCSAGLPGQARPQGGTTEKTIKFGPNSMLSISRRVAPENFVRKGPVQKLVLKGGWDNRKWNDRWIEISDSEFFYCWKAGSVIDKVQADSIQCVKLLNQDETLDRRRSFQVAKSSKHLPSLSSIWPILVHHSRVDAEELQNGFFIQTGVGQHAGREYFFRARTQEEASAWIKSIQALMASGVAKPKSLYAITRSTMRKVFDSNVYGVVTVLLIALNFFAYVYETQARAYALTKRTI